MYARIVQFSGATDIEAGIEFVKTTVAPLLRQQNGYRGLTTSVDRENKLLGTLANWEEKADLDASNSALAKTRDEGQRIIGAAPAVEEFEEVLFEVAEAPSIGSALLIRRISIEPARVDDNLAFFRAEILPQIKQGQGFLAIRQLINRETGQGLVGTVWQNRELLEAAAAEAQKRQQAAGDRGVTFGEQSRREIVFIDRP